MKFHCSECGAVLDIAHELDGEIKKPERGQCINDEPRLPTGAACYNVPVISVKPCQTCIRKYTGPAKKLTDAIKLMSELDKAGE